jgi:hypothetical protein
MRRGTKRRSANGGAASGESRRAERHRTNLLSCDLGDVVDISNTGMRLRCASKPPVRSGQVLTIKLQSAQVRLPIAGQVVWIKRKGLKTYEVGLRFVNMTRSLKAAVESLALFGFIDLEAAAAARAKQEKERLRDEQQQRRQQPEIQAKVDLPDYYGSLGLDQQATLAQIKDAYRELARRYHPDVTTDPEGPRRFIEVTEAYEVLSDPASRRSYDRKVGGSS